MKNPYRTTTTIVSLLLAITCSKAVNLPSRFFYDNQESSHAGLQIDNETAPDESNSQQTNLKFLGEDGGETISIEFLSKLDNVTDFEEFVDLMVPKDTTDSEYGTLSRNSKRNVERALVRKPKPANCIPSDAVVSLMPLNPYNDQKVRYWPTCTRVKRCSGCCNSELMSCQPTSVEAVSFVLRVFRENNGKAQELDSDVAVVEEHKSCKCDCRIKAEHCNILQNYDADQCRCICTNDEERKKCEGAPERFIWDGKTCRCACRESDICTTGTVFVESQCKCLNSTAPTLEERRRLIVKAIPVNPDSSSYYDAA